MKFHRFESYVTIDIGPGLDLEGPGLGLKGSGTDLDLIILALT